MTFGEQLNEYIARLGCTAKELSEASGLSASVISRYRTGSRTPEAGTDTLQSLAGGIARLAEEKGIGELTEASVARALSAALAEAAFPYESLRENLNALLTALSVNVADFARHLNYDTSYISRVRNGQRRPADPEKFASETARYIVRRYAEARDRAVLARLVGCGGGELADDSACLDALTRWLTSGSGAQKDMVFPFLTKVDEFDLNEFIRSIHFDELKVPTVPFQLPASKNYYGLAEFRQAELDFFKAAVLSKSKEPLILMDDTPMADKTEGTDFMKKFIFAVALSLKKGLHLHFIHNINRPFEEMMMGLEGWVPMYMTGQISPYYLKGVHNAVFGHFLFSAGTAALSGECIMGYHENGRFYLTNNKTEVAYYRTRAENLLSKASPLMDIYRSESENLYRSFLQTDAETSGSRRSILSALPLYTISDALLERILERGGLPDADREKIRAYAARQRDGMEEILKRDAVTDEIPLVTREEFERHPMALPLSGLFYEKDVLCTYEDYLEHRSQTEAYAAAHPNYTVRCSGTHTFRNIQIAILEGKWAVISKNKAPAIHFVIRHPKLLSAIENFVAPLHPEEE
ncbi:MAG: helix-turn-helix domain-containing protein [Oscillospiraceae bacterium]